MSTSNFNLRNIPPHVMLLLKQKAIRQQTSVNSLILQIIQRDVGIDYPNKRLVFHDLDHLAGTWDENDKTIFDERTKAFQEIDKELWS